MKILNFFVFGLVIGLSGLTAQTGKVIKNPKLTFEATTIDYGTVEYSADPERVFHFTNTGNAPLMITDAKGSCGCTVPVYPQDAIAPGATAAIRVKYDTKRPGVFQKSITVASNAGDPVILTIKGEVKAAL